MHTGTWLSKQVASSGEGWNWRRLPKTVRYSILGQWTTADSEAYAEACERLDKPPKLRPNFAKPAAGPVNKNKK